jgi:hypothetical protein
MIFSDMRYDGYCSVSKAQKQERLKGPTNYPDERLDQTYDRRA